MIILVTAGIKALHVDSRYEKLVKNGRKMRRAINNQIYAYLRIQYAALQIVNPLLNDFILRKLVVFIRMGRRQVIMQTFCGDSSDVESL